MFCFCVAVSVCVCLLCVFVCGCVCVGCVFEFVFWCGMYVGVSLCVMPVWLRLCVWCVLVHVLCCVRLGVCVGLYFHVWDVCLHVCLIILNVCGMCGCLPFY